MRVYAHRFGSQYGPESSRRALERTLSGRVDGVEVDVILSADGEVLACHDPLLEISTSGLSGWAHEHRAAELRSAQLKDGSGEESDQTIMTLAETLEVVPRELTFELDVKAYTEPDLARRTAARCCEIADEHGRAEQIEVISFFTAACVEASERGVRSRLITWSDYDPPALVKWIANHGIDGLSMEGFIFDRTLSEHVRAAGLTIAVGAVNTAEQVELLLPLEPDIVVSDCPHEVRDMIEQRSKAAAEG